MRKTRKSAFVIPFLFAANLSGQTPPNPAAGAAQGDTPSSRSAVTPGTPSPTEAQFAANGATRAGAADRIASRSGVATSEAPMAVRAMSPTRHNKAMMVVGVAGLLVGAVIGGGAGTIIMIGSGVIGLFGLYQYLQ